MAFHSCSLFLPLFTSWRGVIPTAFGGLDRQISHQLIFLACATGARVARSCQVHRVGSSCSCPRGGIGGIFHAAGVWDPAVALVSVESTVEEVAVILLYLIGSTPQSWVRMCDSDSVVGNWTAPGELGAHKFKRVGFCVCRRFMGFNHRFGTSASGEGWR